MTILPTATGSDSKRPIHGRVPKASDVLTDQLRSEILTTGLKPGDRFLSETEIIQTYGYSRGTVRESLRLLETEGLIVVKRGPRGGTQITRPDITTVSRSMALYLTTSEATLRDFFVFRRLIEPAAAELAAKWATPGQRQEISALAEETSPTPGPTSLKRSPDFHAAIGQATNSRVLTVVLESMHQVLEWHTPTERLSSTDIAATVAAHGRIAAAIRDGDGKTAAQAMRVHVEEYERVLENQERLDQPIMHRSQWNSGL
ncbi:MAG TPA: FCD domain-containing protein [Pseudonocardia sp.]|jgi:GntR family transcriptional repressor for pyruvate dehydrogenase complex|nr:FCD domain-containing protein [Pseudonocardia sp.]